MRLLSPPNLVVLARAALVAPIVWLLSRPEPEAATAAAGLFFVAAISDSLDGYLARRMRLVTRLGAFLDPLADKLLVIGTLIALQSRGVLPAWVVVIVVARELVVTNLRAIAAARGYSIAASFYGKVKTIAQSVATFGLILTLVISDPTFVGFARLLLVIAVVLTVLSGLDYLAKASWAIAGGPVPERWRTDRTSQRRGHERAR